MNKNYQPLGKDKTVSRPMKHKVCVTTLIGIPGAGKTTFVTNLRELDKTHQLIFSVLHICYDDFIPIETNFHNYCDPRAKAFSNERKLLRQFVSLLIQFYITGKGTKALKNFSKTHFQGALQKLIVKNVRKVILIVIDDNMYFRSMRYEFVKICRKFEVGYFPIFFICELSVALKRRPQIPEDVIRKMHGNIVVPKSEIAWEKDCLFLPTIVSIEDYVNELNELVFMKISNPEMRPLKIYAPPENNVNVTIETILRKEIHRRITLLREDVTNDSQAIKAAVYQLTLRKRIVRKELESGALAMPTNLEDVKNYL